MALRDKISHSMAALEYATGTWIARILVRSVGTGSRIHVSVRYWSPSRVLIGTNCEIRNGTFLDARSDRDVSIIVGDGSRIKDYVGLAAYGGRIELGKRVLVGRCSTIFGHGGVYIGDDTMIGPDVLIVSSDHMAYLGNTAFQDQGFTREPVNIEKNVWIGANTCVLAGTNIASNVVVGAGAVVQGTLPGGWLYSGIPAKPVKQLGTQKPEDLIVHTRDWDLL